MEPKQLASVIKRAFAIREGSYSPNDSATFSTSGRYAIDTREAVLMAIVEEGVSSLFAEPIYLAAHWGNDLLAWADEILARK